MRNLLLMIVILILSLQSNCLITPVQKAYLHSVDQVIIDDWFLRVSSDTQLDDLQKVNRRLAYDT